MLVFIQIVVKLYGMPLFWKAGERRVEKRRYNLV